jgi:hypothetical protein
MSDYFHTIKVDCDRFVSISTLEEPQICDEATDGLGDHFGYFIYEHSENISTSGIEILAKCPTYEAAFRLLCFLGKVKATK